MTETIQKLIIESVRQDGRKFRPSDWIERLSANLGTFGPDHRLHYDSRVVPSIVNGEKCLVVDQDLKANNPAAYEFIVNFAESNGLRFHVETMTGV